MSFHVLSLLGYRIFYHILEDRLKVSENAFQSLKSSLLDMTEASLIFSVATLVLFIKYSKMKDQSIKTG